MGVKKVANQKIREKAATLRVKLWEVADAYGLSDGNFSRKLRRELPEDEQQRILSIIEQIARERA